MPCDLISLARASLLLAQEQFGAAEAVLNDLIDDYPQGLRLRPLLDAQLMLALALFGQQRLNAARQVMATAVRAAAAEGMIRPFLDCDRQIVPLLALVQQTEKLSIASAALVQDVLKELQASHGLASAVSREELFHLAAAAAISQREQEVLQLVGDGLSNRQIAEQLYIAPSTVKTHLKNIYRKLEVNGRAQAVARAQTLALLW
jgi:LuxR family maltose regulon positive regulatory protein